MTLNLTVTGPEGAPPLVLSNALGTSSQMWDRQLDAFSRSFTVVRYEHAPRPSVAELADSIIDALDRVGVRQFSFCGLSLGAMVGMTIAAVAPDRVDRLVLACTSARLGHETECNERCLHRSSTRLATTSPAEAAASSPVRGPAAGPGSRARSSSPT